MPLPPSASKAHAPFSEPPASDPESRSGPSSHAARTGNNNSSSSNSNKNKKKGPADSHIRRPRNAFIFFRSHFYNTQTRREVSEDGRPINQQDVSKQVGVVWHAMSDAEQAPFYAMAERELEEHKRRWPHYHLKAESRKRTSSGKRKRAVAAAVVVPQGEARRKAGSSSVKRVKVEPESDESEWVDSSSAATSPRRATRSSRRLSASSSSSLPPPPSPTPSLCSSLSESEPEIEEGAHEQRVRTPETELTEIRPASEGLPELHLHSVWPFEDLIRLIPWQVIDTTGDLPIYFEDPIPRTDLPNPPTVPGDIEYFEWPEIYPKRPCPSEQPFHWRPPTSSAIPSPRDSVLEGEQVFRRMASTFTTLLDDEVSPEV